MRGSARVGVFLLLLFTYPTSGSADGLQVTNQEKGNLGFNVTQQNLDAGCSRIFSNEQVLLESPGYPSGYPANSDCTYIFKGPVCPTYFNLQFLDFNLMQSSGCTSDRLEILKKDALCGSTSGIKSYYSENGVLEARFVSDGEASGRGFKMLVTRQLCGAKPETTTADPNIAWEMTPVTVAARGSFLPPQTPSTPQNSFCCANAYNSKHFFLSSPGFPNGNNNAEDCVYHIYRANPNVCRLRLHFRFFWSGEQDPNYGCNRGSLEVDGKHICGCRTGLKLISAFDSRFGNAPKVLRFKNSGFPRSVFNGFALEVIQDECPKRLVPTDNSDVKAQASPQFYFYNDQINRVAWPLNNNQNSIERALLVSENTEILDDNGNNNPNSDSGVVKHIYFFEAPDDDGYDYGYDVRTAVKEPREIEETSYLDTCSLGSFLPAGYDNSKCTAWGALQWASLSQELLWQQMPQCISGRTPSSRQCEQFNYVRGYIQSPGYPNSYPENARVCYRLNKQRGYCAIRLSFDDFNVEDSFECRKDFLLLGGEYRYCGQNLHQSVLTFDLRNSPYEEIVFISDRYSRGRGRGFKATYEQIPCDNVPVNPPNPVYPPKPTTPYPPLTPRPPHPTKPQSSCNRDIQDDFFVIEIYGHDQPRCAINIIKNNPSVCRINVIFHSFQLDCRSEYLLINNRRYCGQIPTQSLSAHFSHYQLPIIYERSTGNPALTGLRVRFSVSQLSDDCDPYQYPKVPAERLLVTSNKTNNQLLGNAEITEINKVFSERKYDNDACGVMLNAPEDTIAASICTLLTERDSSTRCIQITPKEIYVPYNTEESTLQNAVLNEIGEMTSFYGVEEVGVQEISCDDLSRLAK